jgi:glycosyltransferase involved in cell wall biosynthesis
LASNQLSQLKIFMLLDNPFISDARVEKEALALINAGASVTVICTHEQDLPILENRKRISIHRILGSEFNSPLRFTFYSFLRSQVQLILKFEFDVLHCHDFHMLTIGAAVKKQKKNIKLIYDAHEYLLGWPFYQSAGEWKNRFKGRIVWNYLVHLERKNIANADSVITITKGIAERLQKNNHLKDEPLVLGNFANKNELKTDKTYFQKKYNLKSGAKLIVHTGTIYHTDNQLKTLFKCVVEQKNLSLVFIGNRPRFYELKQIIEDDQELKQRIFFHEYLSNQEENINLISCGDIGLMHVRDKWKAHQIGFSNRFVEYIMAELPVIATPQEFTRELNNLYDCCTFYSENNEEELKEGIVEIISNFPKFRTNVLRAKNQMDWEKESGKLINHYFSLYA